jgi:glycosyltransferase involved in cell wall biosynthesis
MLTALHHRRFGVPLHVVVISGDYVDWATSLFPHSPVSVLPLNLAPIYSGAAPPLGSAPCTRNDVFVIGDMSNPRSALGLASIIEAMDPSARPQVFVASSRPLHQSLVPHVGRSVVDLGFVDDPRPYYRAAGAALVPAFVAGGVKTTVIQAWASGCPVVTTTAAATPLGATPGVHLLAASTPRDAADGLRRVLSDPALADRLRTDGAQRFAQTHSDAAVRKVLEDLVTRVTADLQMTARSGAPRVR